MNRIARVWVGVVAGCSLLVGPAQTQEPPPQARVPVVVPVTVAAPPYSTNALWKAFSAGDTVSEAFRLRYSGRACENSEYFARRERVYDCRALELGTWLVLGAPRTDEEIARLALARIDSTGLLLGGADSAWNVNALIVAVTGRRGPPRTIPVAYTATRGWRPAFVRQVVLIGIPQDSAKLSEAALIQVFPAVVGLGQGALVRDQQDSLHLHPDARHSLDRKSVSELPGDTLARINIEVMSCGDINCIEPSPDFVVSGVNPVGGERLFISVRYGDGLLIERAMPMAGTTPRSDRGVGREWRWLVSPGDAVQIPVHSRGRSAYLRIRWEGMVAFVSLHRPG